MHPKIRSPFTTWLFTVITGGLYLFVWVWNISVELNRAEGRMVLPIHSWRNIAATLFLLSATGIVLYVNVRNPLFFIAPALLLFAFFIYVQLAIGNYIKLKYAQHGIAYSFSNILSVVLFWLVANTGIAYIQSGINRVINHEQKNS